MEEFFAKTTLPESIQLDECTFIENAPKFVANHISVLKGNSGNHFFMPYWDRLVKLKTLLCDTEKSTPFA